MAKFLNKKEQVYDLQLTSYGRYTLSIGSFKPTYYAFLDDNIIYDKDYARTSGSVDGLSGSFEPQNEIMGRIRDTQHLESQVLFEDVEFLPEIITYENGNFNTNISPVKRTPRKDVYRYNNIIGDAYLTGPKNVAPAWKLITLQGDITWTDLADITSSTRIPQLNIDAFYTKKIIYRDALSSIGNTNPSSFGELVSVTDVFSDGNRIAVESNDLLVYGEELNTELLTENFDVEVYEIIGDTAAYATGSVTFTVGACQEGDTLTLNDGTHQVIYEFSDTGSGVSPNFKPGVSPNYANGWYVNRDKKAEYSTNAGYFEEAIDTGPELFITTMLKTNMQEQNATLWLTNLRQGVGGNQTITATFTDTNSVQLQGMEGGAGGNEVLSRKYFERLDKQVVDGFLVVQEKSLRSMLGSENSLTTSSVEYYFDFLADHEVDQQIACKSMDIYNKTSYYIDIDFNCDEEDDTEVTYYDIYGISTEPEICQT
jgi:hypothetical protein